MRVTGMRMRIMVAGVALAAVTAGGVQLIYAADDDPGPIRVGTADRVSSLDPAGAYDASSWALFSNVYQSLLTFRSGATKPVPDAARECAFTDDELLTYACELRPGLRFAGGRDITSADVKFSFDRMRVIDDAQGPLPLLDTLKHVSTDGPRKVVFELKSPDATFPFKIATGAGSIVDRDDYPATELRTDNDVTGSGPYILKSFDQGSAAELRPNPDYKGASDHKGKPISIRYYRDSAKLEKAWEGNELDVAARGMPPSALATAESSGDGTRVMEGTGASTRNIVFNTKGTSGAHDVAVRRAVAAVVDREAIARDVHARTVDPLYSLIPKGITGHTTPFYDAYPEPDERKAKKLLTAAGIKAPVRLTLGYARDATARSEAEEVKAQLERTGLFEVTTKGPEWAEFQNEFVDGAYDMFLISWIADFPDPDTFTSPLIGSGAGWYNGYKSDRVNDLIRTTQRQSERARTVSDFRTIEKIAAEDIPVLPLYQKKVHVISTDSIAGTQYLSDGTGNWRLWELDRI